VRVLYAQGCHLFLGKEEPLGQPDDRIAEALAAAEESDAVVLVVGLDETLEGEEGDTGNAAASGDKLDLLLPESQRKLMDAVMKVGKPTVICLMVGSAIDLQDAGEKANALLLTWYPGARGGRTVADILFGQVSPSGKLPVTFYHNEQLAQMPAFEDYSMRGRTYRYFEHQPLYPFGYGLTYGDTYVRQGTVIRKDGGLQAELLVCNDGKATREVVQLYVQNEGSANAPRNPRLCAFKRIELAAGEQKTVVLNINPEALKIINDAGESIMEGKPVFFAGVSQPDPRSFELTGHECIKIEIE